MIVKMNNKHEDFYRYMGKLFGSRIVQRQVNDRIYDDNDKEWYLNIKEERVVCFVSVTKNIIKNVYTIQDSYLLDVLELVKKENEIEESIVPNIYKQIYLKANFKVNNETSMKNFVIIYDKLKEE